MLIDVRSDIVLVPTCQVWDSVILYDFVGSTLMFGLFRVLLGSNPFWKVGDH